jgi:hypothetical protein
MAHFYSRCYGGRGETTRSGHKTTGITASAFGWDLGGTIRMEYDDKLKTDVLKLYVTRENNRDRTLYATLAVIEGRLTTLFKDSQ